MRIAQVGGLLVMVWSLGCSSSSSNSTSSGGTSSVTSAGGATQATSSATSTGGEAGSGGAPATLESQVSACTQDLSAAQIEANLELVGSLDQSVHELVACGGLTIRVVGALVRGVIEMLANNDDDITPDGLVFEGEGTYRSGARDATQDTDMLLIFSDTSSGEPVPIPDDVFLASTYLVGASAETVVVVDENNPLNSTVVVEIEFDAVGPQVELLGFGAEPESPIRIESSELGELGLDIDEVVLETEVSVIDDRGESSVNYDVATGPDPVLDIFDSSKLDYRIIEVSGSNTAAEQDLTLADDGWQIEFAGGNQLVGSIDFSVKGGAFDYDGRFTYDSTSYAAIELSCAE